MSFIDDRNFIPQLDMVRKLGQYLSGDCLVPAGVMAEWLWGWGVGGGGVI